MNIPNHAASIAVSEEDRKLTYGELHDRAGRLAAHLRALGAGPETLVGLCFPRSVSLVVGAVGIMKSGAAYLPIDPYTPSERMAAMLSDSKTRIVVASESAAALVPKGDWQVITLDCAGNGSGFPEPAGADVEFPLERLAYVIYTSGSTGKPKGVEITHANLDHLIRWHHRAFAVSGADHATLFASPGFDASVWEMWPYLVKGATLHIPLDSIRATPAALRDWMLKERITVSFLPTALAERMLDLKWPPAQTSLRFLLTGADTLRHRPPAGLPFEFVNNYGPTECTVVATSGIVPPGEDSNELPSIGRAIDGAIIDIRNGEILIGGAGVARGYRFQPALTSERFIDDVVHGRMYRTGDMAALLPNGEIAFQGRADDQIKIRGFRIEPNEIVRALAKNPLVRESAVVLRGPVDTDKRLVAYIVPNSATELSERGLQEALRKSLPDYMMPSVFVMIDALPYTENGKLDRNALPDPSPANIVRDDEFEAPGNPLEEQVAATVCELLHLDRAGINDNFFLLGGHSLFGAQLVDRLNRDFEVDLTLRAVFDYPTVAGLASVIEEAILERVESMSEEEAQRLLS